MVAVRRGRRSACACYWLHWFVCAGQPAHLCSTVVRREHPARSAGVRQLRPTASGVRAPRVVYGSTWFPPTWTTPDRGVLVLWSHAEYLTPPARQYWSSLGRSASIDHRPARLRSGQSTAWCPTGAATELDAYVRTSARYPGDRVDMRACFGGHASSTDRHAVSEMLDSLRISDYPPAAPLTAAIACRPDACIAERLVRST
jgi:hypothetical protein